MAKKRKIPVKNQTDVFGNEPTVAPKRSFEIEIYNIDFVYLYCQIVSKKHSVTKVFLAKGKQFWRIYLGKHKPEFIVKIYLNGNEIKA